MSSFKFGHKEVAFIAFHKQRQITGILTIDVSIMLSDKVSLSNGKDWQYIVDYQVVGETITLRYVTINQELCLYKVI